MDNDSYSKPKKRGLRRQANYLHKEVRSPKYRPKVVDMTKKKLLTDLFIAEQLEELYNNNDEPV